MNNDIDAAVFQDIKGLIEQIQAINKQTILLINPQIDEIIRNHITDCRHIEQLLDTLLDCAGTSNDALVLFKRLCRYYYCLNPNTVAAYVNAYRDLYDSDADDDSERNECNTDRQK